MKHCHLLFLFAVALNSVLTFNHSRIQVKRFNKPVRAERKLIGGALLGGAAGMAAGGALMGALGGPSDAEKAALRKVEMDIENTNNFYLHNVLERGNIITELGHYVEKVDRQLNSLRSQSVADVYQMNGIILGSLQHQKRNIDYLMKEDPIN